MVYMLCKEQKLGDFQMQKAGKSGDFLSNLI